MTGRFRIEGMARRLYHMTSDRLSCAFRWWWLKLKVLVELKDWEGLDAFAKSKKSPIGYEPFVVSTTMMTSDIQHDV